MADKEVDLDRVRQVLGELIAPESGYFKAAIVYGIAISLLTLAVPIAVQTLVNTVANIASTRAVLILSGLLLVMLVLSGALNALRTHVMEMYERKIYARLMSEISLKAILAPHSVFEGRQNSTITQRYFEIMTLQKNIPSLLIDGFALLLQLLVGFTLVSFYHPVLFVFNLVVMLFIYLIWRIWGADAKRTAIQLSAAKYASAKWLSDLTAAHEFFKSSRHMDYAGRTTETLIGNYVNEHRQHFKYTFTQNIAFLALYALASAGLLGLGGWLVVRGELSLGQLVAAELIMSAVFVGISQFTIYLKMYYELFGAADKIGQILALPQEVLHEDQDLLPADGTLQCKDLELSHQGELVNLSFSIESGAKVWVVTDKGWIQRRLSKLLKLQEPVVKGWLRLGRQAMEEYDVYELRQAIDVIDRSLIVECTIKDYFKMAAPDVSLVEMNAALALVDLEQTVVALPDAMDTRLSSLGAPLLPLELLLLKLAVAIVAQPKIVLLNQDFDNLLMAQHDNVMKAISCQPFSVLYFTHNPKPQFFDATLQLTSDGLGNGSNGLEVSGNSSHE
ncbi:MAG: putative ABC transport system ATP-binding protein [Candidatus Azotimanducaceae bacterium]